jgi:uncharacterized phage-associated protein
LAYDPRAIANLLLKEADERHVPLSNLKLQKLLFLCHATYLVRTGQPLINGSFEAWQYGPVHRVTYHAFKHFGAKPITEAAMKFNPVTGIRVALELPEAREVSDIVRDVLRAHGARSPGELVELTHAKDGPWDYVVSAAKESANLGLKIRDEVIVQRFKYLWFGEKPNYKNEEPYEDTPLVA